MNDQFGANVICHNRCSVLHPGNSASPNAVSTPPLLRAITEESNVSQDSDEGASLSSATLEKILTGEYDVTTLPYSQYLELLKDSGSLNPNAGQFLKSTFSKTLFYDCYCHYHSRRRRYQICYRNHHHQCCPDVGLPLLYQEKEIIR